VAASVLLQNVHGRAALLHRQAGSMSPKSPNNHDVCQTVTSMRCAAYLLTVRIVLVTSVSVSILVSKFRYRGCILLPILYGIGPKCGPNRRDIPARIVTSLLRGSNTACILASHPPPAAAFHTLPNRATCRPPFSNFRCYRTPLHLMWHT
jgi:hypothetical protein